MAEWSNATMTDVGADLQAKVNAGKTKLTFTKIKVGSGVNATNPLALTDVISSKWETTNFVVKQEGKIVSVDTFITNTGIHEAFRMSEIGLFAQDPDKGEILYAYLTDPEPDRMPAEGGSVVVSQELTIGMVFSNTGNVSLTVNMGALVTHEQLTEAVKQHNDDENAHGGLLQNLKSQLATHNTDISSHPAITAMIAKILGATNWQENPVATLKDIKNLLGMGGIVAQRLEENGFVKFANGFTIQWGAENESRNDPTITKAEIAHRYSHSVWVTFPIAYTQEVFGVYASKGAGVNCPGTRLYKNDKFVLDHSDSRNGFVTHWISIGV